MDDLGAVMKKIQRIVVGTDFSDIAERAVDQAVDLAAQLGGKVTLVHAYELPMYSYPDGVVVSSSDAAQQVTTIATQRLASSVEQRKERGVRIESVLRMGPPWDELNSVAAEEVADLIVVGTHGRRGFSRILLGSVAERLVKTAVRPVLVVH